MYGNVSDFVDTGGSLGKRCLFFLTAYYPEIRLPGDRVKRQVKHLVFLPVPVYSVSRLYVVFTINFITFPHVPLTFLHVPPWLSKRFVDISYVPIRSEQPSRSFRKKCTQSIRSYTFCATLPQIRRKLYSNHTFLYVLSNPLAVLA